MFEPTLLCKTLSFLPCRDRSSFSLTLKDHSFVKHTISAYDTLVFWILTRLDICFPALETLEFENSRVFEHSDLAFLTRTRYCSLVYDTRPLIVFIFPKPAYSALRRHL